MNSMTIIGKWPIWVRKCLAIEERVHNDDLSCLILSIPLLSPYLTTSSFLSIHFLIPILPPAPSHFSLCQLQWPCWYKWGNILLLPAPDIFSYTKNHMHIIRGHTCKVYHPPINSNPAPTHQVQPYPPINANPTPTPLSPSSPSVTPSSFTMLGCSNLNMVNTSFSISLITAAAWSAFIVGILIATCQQQKTRSEWHIPHNKTHLYMWQYHTKSLWSMFLANVCIDGSLSNFGTHKFLTLSWQQVC